MKMKLFTPAQKVQYWTKKLEEVRQAKEVFKYFEKAIAARLRKAQSAEKQVAA